MGTHYTVLGCDCDCSSEEIKKKYQELVLRYHPDKSTTSTDDSSEKFLEITKAWNVLRNPESRHRYDAELKHLQTIDQPIIYLTIERNELSIENEMYYYTCRCGGLYTIPKEELISPESLVQCDECSFSILIKSE